MTATRSKSRKNSDVVDQAAAAGMQIYGDIFAIPSAVLDQTIRTALQAKDAVKRHAGRLLKNPGWYDQESDNDARNSLMFAASRSRNAEELARIHKWAVTKRDSDLKAVVEARAGELGISMSKIQANYPARWNPQVTDRALRYRANANAPEGAEQCCMCGSKTSIDVGHVDGHEENNEEENLIWICRSCNVTTANVMRDAGMGRLTRQYNPGKSGKGASSTEQWITAVMSMKGLSNEMPVSEAVEMIRATSPAKRSEYARGIWDMRRSKGNPENLAAEAYKRFHGRPSTEEIVIEEQVHFHKNLATLGVLAACVFDTPLGDRVTLNFDSDDGHPVPWLCMSEDGVQLYIEGGDQSIELEAIGMEGDNWYKERMVLGTFSEPEPGRKWNLAYITEKNFDSFETIRYEHDLGEPDEGEPKNHRREAPTLEFEPLNQKLFICGGQYKISLPLLETSPGIEN